jgi:hypothetical protein
MKKRILLVLSVVLTAGTVCTSADSSPAPKVYFIEPADGAVVKSPVKVVFGLSGMGVAPAGVKHDNTGHHHLLVDTGLPNMKTSIQKDEKHLHFGAGQTETTVTLPPGKHTLQLLLGDFAHIPHNPPVMSERITIETR